MGYWYYMALPALRRVKIPSARAMFVEKRVAGVDEAGKGPVLGPMLVACVVADEHTLSSLKALGVKDSKRLSPAMRSKLAVRIEQMAEVHLLELLPQDIDYMRARITMNLVMVHCFSELLFRACADVAYVDAADVNEKRFASRLMENISERGCFTEVVASHRADAHIPIVSAASIVAKVHRDAAISKLASKYHRRIGSGYPSDPRTVSFIRGWIAENGTVPPCARATWATCARLLKDAAQSRSE